jgi:tripartite-type tricarboxylate transporter receptor subunit TctC
MSCDAAQWALKNAVADPTTVARFKEDGGVPTAMSPSEFAKFLADDEANWHKMVEVAGIAAE